MDPVFSNTRDHLILLKHSTKGKFVFKNVWELVKTHKYIIKSFQKIWTYDILNIEIKKTKINYSQDLSAHSQRRLKPKQEDFIEVQDMIIP